MRDVWIDDGVFLSRTVFNTGARPVDNTRAIVVTVATIALSFASAGAAHAQAADPRIVMKIASVAPSNTPYSTAIEKLAAAWERISNGTVRVIVYENGVAGDQSDMLRKMRIGQLQGGLFDNTGLTDVVPGAIALSIPYLVQSDAEYTAVMHDVRSILEQEAQQHGFVSVAWARVGWVYLFSAVPVRTPSDAKSLKFLDDTKVRSLSDTFRALGFRVSSVDLPETLTALNSGMGNAVFSTPSLVAGYQWFAITRYMTDFRVAPAVGALLITSEAWNRIPAPLRPKFLSAAGQIERDLPTEIDQGDGEAIRIMEQYGLVPVSVSDADVLSWRQELASDLPNITGAILEARVVTLIRDRLAELRGARSR